MSLRDFTILVVICAVWASNNIISKIVVTDLGIPPLIYSALRFGIVALAMSPWLLPAPKPLWRVIIVALLMGGGNFSLMFIGLQTATPSASAVVMQMGVPMTILLSMVILREEVGIRRGVGIALSLGGALVVIWNPEGLALSAGLFYIAAACLLYSIGAVMMKGMEIKPLQLQAWVGFSSFWPLIVLSGLVEHGQFASLQTHLVPFLAALIYSALVVSVIAHTIFYGLIQRYDASLLQPITLLTPLLTIFGGVLITHDPFGWRMAVGATIALAGVLIIVLRVRHVAGVMQMFQRSAP